MKLTVIEETEQAKPAALSEGISHTYSFVVVHPGCSHCKNG